MNHLDDFFSLSVAHLLGEDVPAPAPPTIGRTLHLARTDSDGDNILDELAAAWDRARAAKARPRIKFIKRCSTPRCRRLTRHVHCDLHRATKGDK